MPPQRLNPSGRSCDLRVDSITSDSPARVLLIGCGAIGSVIAGHLSRSEAIGHVIASDLDFGLAQRVVSNSDGRKFTPLRLDAGEEAAVRQAAVDSQIVVNCSIPRFNATIQHAALAAGAHYLDLANATSDPLVETDRWKVRGLTAIVGLGQDPGLSNLLVRHAADGMTSVESVRIRDGDTGTNAEYPFVCLFSPETFVDETLHVSRIWEDGAYRSVPPFGERETFAFPDPVGPLTVYSVDHEEVDTLPGAIGKGVRYVDFKLALDDNSVQILTHLRDLRLLEPGPPGGPSPRKAVFATIPKPGDLVGKIDGYAALLVEVVGEVDGVRKLHTLFTILGHPDASRKYGATGTAYLTGTTAACGVILLASGKIAERGVLSPESLDPAPFFPMLRERGIAVQERVTWERTLG